MQKELREQLAKFVKDDSYFKEYEGVEPMWDFYLVRLFKFLPKKGEMKTSIMVPDPLTGEWGSSSKIIDSKRLPIVKVIKASIEAKNTNIKAGDVYTVPSNEILGRTVNPEWLHMVNTFKSPGGKQGSIVNLPDGVRQWIPNVEKYWDLNMFVHPNNYGYPTDEDKLTYLIPSSKLKTKHSL